MDRWMRFWKPFASLIETAPQGWQTLFTFIRFLIFVTLLVCDTGTRRHAGHKLPAKKLSQRHLSQPGVTPRHRKRRRPR